MGALWDAAKGGFTGLAIMCLVLLAIAYFVIYFIAGSKVIKIRIMKFKMPKAIDDESLSGLLVAPLTAYDMTVNRADNIVITYKGCEFYVTLCNEYFSIDPRESMIKPLFGKSQARLYKRSIIAVPILAYTIQNVCGNLN